MRSRRTPNDLLRGLLTEAGWTGETLARTVNAVGAEAGLRLRYQRMSVTQWLSGVKPRPPVPELVAEGLSRALGRRVPASATGLEPPDTAPEHTSGHIGEHLWQEIDAVTRLAQPNRSGTCQRDVVADHVYSLAALSPPTRTALAATHPHRRADCCADTDAGTKVGHVETQSAAAMLQLFSDADSTFGGGHARRALTGYLAYTIAPWLRAKTSPTVRGELQATAARLAYLCGFMCFDDKLHGTAQHYYLTSLQLAAHAGDATSYAVALRALSVQARLLGHHRHAVDLAEAAVRAASADTPEHTRAFLHGQLAVAHAAADDRHDALTHLSAAESLLSHADNHPAVTSDAVGAYHAASLAHQHAATAACLGQRRAAIRALSTSIRHRPPGERRSRAITLARLAELQAADGHLEQACDTWQHFLDDYPQLQSRRADTALATLRARTRPHQNAPVVRALRARAAALNTARHTSG